MSETQLIFRSARREDIPAIVALLLDDPLGIAREGAHELSCYYSAYENFRDDLNNEIVVGEVNGEVIATLQLTIIHGLTRRGASRAQIEGVRVASHYRSAGVGTDLMRWAMARAKERGCSLVQLTTDNTRPDAHRFYKRLGFVASHTGMKCDIGLRSLEYEDLPPTT